MSDAGPESDVAGARSPVPRLRAAVDADARALHRLMASVYEEGRWFVGDGPPRPDTLARRLRALDPKRELFVVAEMPGRRRAVAIPPASSRSAAAIVGWVEAHRYAPERMEHVASFTLAVAAEARGRGIGRALLRAIPPWAERVGVRKLRLDVRADNVAARRLYESEGFAVEGIERCQVRRDADGRSDDDRADDDRADDVVFEDNVIMARFL